MSPNHIDCNCQIPPGVDLTDAYRLNFEASQSICRPSSSSSASSALDEVPFNDQLYQNLNTFGWSPISIRKSRIPKNAPLRQGSCEALWERPKETISSLFDPEFCNSNPFPNAIFRTAESGSAGENTAEPKQSWEVRRCSHYDKILETSNNDNVLKDMTQALHSVITTVESSLKLPSNLLVQGRMNGVNDSKTGPYGCRCQEKESNTTEPCNVDLLRVFYYDKVEERTNDDDEKILGSSKHTDWGTWTVVWQDTVGGLQTFCPKCQVWQDVPASKPEQMSEVLHFVIHVGDATSLAMGHALQRVRADEETAANRVDDGSRGKVAWPSPLHRVISPVLEPRASLVYFVYPPPGRSLASLSEGLVPWLNDRVPSDSKRPVIPYDEYYLLHDQSSAGNNNKNNKAVKTPKEMFDLIFETPMEKVFAEKWNQVQRTH